ncbi:MAG: hypothetical protein M0P19_13615 [Nevskia sp.]|jgi:hypothetical protein|nr:hypothetical protein [Nevskia sp.]MCK9385967.1 hypothetical protein [Nevskia sp.]
MNAALAFSDGSVGDFTSRVRWTSSDPAVVAVSNGDIPFPGASNSFYPRGTLVASNTLTGSAVISADFSGLSSSLNVDASVPTDFKVQLVDGISGTVSPIAGDSFRMAPGSSQDLTVTASLDGINQNVEAAATWSFDNGNPQIATIAPPSGVITTLGAGGPFVARATFPACGDSVTANINAVPATGIVIRPEFETNGQATDLIVPNREAFRIFADFGSGPEQDISLASVLVSSSEVVASVNTALGATSVVSAVTAGGPVTLNTTFAQINSPLTAPAVALTTVSGTLQSIAIEPATATVVAGSSDILTFHVIGTYADGRTQDLSRIANWISSDNGIATVSTGVGAPGQAVSTSRTLGVVTITANIPTATTVTAATAQLTTTTVSGSGPQ